LNEIVEHAKGGKTKYFALWQADCNKIARMAMATPSRCLSRISDLSNSAKLPSILNSSLFIELSSPVNVRFSFRNPVPNATSVATSESPP